MPLLLTSDCMPSQLKVILHYLTIVLYHSAPNPKNLILLWKLVGICLRKDYMSWIINSIIFYDFLSMQIS